MTEVAATALDARAIEKAVGRATAERGRQYLAAGDVLAVTRRGNQIDSKVRGSARRPYRQVTHLQADAAGAITIRGTCTCPVGSNCKHVAAALFSLLTDPGPARTIEPAPALLVPAPAPPSLALPLSPADDGLGAWLRELEGALAGKPAAPAPSLHRLVYVFHVQRRRTRIEPWKVRIRKDGGMVPEARPYLYQPRRHGADTPPKFMQAADPELLFRLDALFRGGEAALEERLAAGAADPVQVRGLLLDLLATGRLMWDGPKGLRPLAEGPARRARFDWQSDVQGRQEIRLLAAAEEVGFDLALPSAPPWYVDIERALCGPLLTDLDDRAAGILARAPPLGIAQSEPVARALTRVRSLSAVIPLPQAFERVRAPAVPPVPVLTLDTISLEIRRDHRWLGRWAPPLTVELPIIRLAFDYEGLVLAEGSEEEPERRRDRQIVVSPRAKDDEARAVATLRGLGLVELPGSRPKAGPDRRQSVVRLPAAVSAELSILPLEERQPSPEPYLALQHEALPELVRAGWRVEQTPSWPWRLVEEPVEWRAEIGEGSGIGWLELALGIEVGGERLDLLPLLGRIVEELPLGPDGGPPERAALEAMLAHTVIYPRLPDGRLLPLPGPRILPLIEALYDLLREEPEARGKLTLHESGLGDLAAIAGLGNGVAWAGRERLTGLLAVAEGLRGEARQAPPEGFRATLRPYQEIGLGWLQALGRAGFGGILADDMGLGKTIQALAHIAAEKAAGRLERPCLLVAPTSLVGHWRREAERFAPELRVLVLHGLDRRPLFAAIPDHDLVITTYPLLRLDQEALAARPYALLVLDEAQAVKNPRSAGAKAVDSLEAAQRLVLTGTPLENNLEELWSLFHIAVPGLLGDLARFRRVFRTPIEKQRDQGAQARLNRRIRPFLLRRTKEAVAPELPEKTVIVETVELGDAQRDLYEIVRLAMDERVRRSVERLGLSRSRITILDAILKLRQVCCDPALVKLEAARRVTESVKRRRLMELLETLLAEDSRVILFSQFVEMLKLIQADLDRQGIPYALLTGQTEDRDAQVARFQAGEVRLFLLSLKAGGTGLNLTAADTVILYDPWWNPAVEAQAMDRAHRIGQTKPVFVYKLVAAGTVEAAILELQKRKSALIQAVYEDGTDQPLDLTEEDLARLLAPVG